MPPTTLPAWHSRPGPWPALLALFLLLLAAAHTHDAHLLHHLLHVAELLDQHVDVLHGRAAARGNAPPPAGVEQVRIAPFGQRHAVDDRLGLLQAISGPAAGRGPWSSCSRRESCPVKSVIGPSFLICLS